VIELAFMTGSFKEFEAKRGRWRGGLPNLQCAIKRSPVPLDTRERAIGCSEAGNYLERVIAMRATAQPNLPDDGIKSILPIGACSRPRPAVSAQRRFANEVVKVGAAYEVNARSSSSAAAGAGRMHRVATRA
jgi:hypothetical protein